MHTGNPDESAPGSDGVADSPGGRRRVSFQETFDLRLRKNSSIRGQSDIESWLSPRGGGGEHREFPLGWDLQAYRTDTASMNPLLGILSDSHLSEESRLMSLHRVARLGALTSLAMLIVSVASAQEAAKPAPAAAKPAPAVAKPAPAAAKPAPAAATPAPAVRADAPKAPAAAETGGQVEAAAPTADAAAAAPADATEPSPVEASAAVEAQASTAEPAADSADAVVLTPPPATPEPQPAELVQEEESIVAGYDKGFVLRDKEGNNSMKFVGLLQVGYQYDNLDGADDHSAFGVNRGRFGATGTALTSDMAYYFLVDFGKGTTNLIYYFADYTIAKDALQLRVGQFKRPFSRQYLTSSGNLEFITRPVTTNVFQDNIDVGAMLHNGSPAFEYAVGVFNGQGYKGVYTGTADLETGALHGVKQNNVPERFHPAVVGRVGYNHNGIKGYSDADLEGGDLRFAVAAAGISDFDFDRNDTSAVRGTVDGVIKVEGFSLTAAGYVGSVQDGTGFGDRALEAFGAFAQTGYVIAERFQPLVRYAVIARDGSNNDEHDLAAGFNVYFYGHSLKWQNELNFSLQAFGDDLVVEPSIGTQLGLSI